ncbi:membrane-associated proteins in eicosanoid and glutathione metabolism [Coprinellus micaceus]|uniref:Membrane-associated proteins in eicosanoid and glutathione metabolism n=1 Tax=Coprinellus micaceus TaxID=71717 RepID=A0A4Y7TYP6_COPMI|nr:membrane-associated proteins in eicosanoid and glutathione metabolism [Coprinellus micaceus]
MSVVLPQGFGYVGAAILSTAFVLLGQSQVVSFKRKKSGIQYPQMYATAEQEKDSKDALIFNCAQRAHQNTLENIPIVYVTTIISGLHYPVFAASACAFWSLSRVFYTRGYITGDPKKRVSAVYGLATVGLLGNLFASAYVAGGWVLQNLSL